MGFEDPSLRLIFRKFVGPAFPRNFPIPAYIRLHTGVCVLLIRVWADVTVLLWKAWKGRGLGIPGMPGYYVESPFVYLLFYVVNHPAQVAGEKARGRCLIEKYSIYQAPVIYLSLIHI